MRILLTLIVLVALTACKTTSLVKILKSGSYDANSPVVEINYHNKLNILIIPVEINGKTYQFMFDTGAPNVISPEVAEAIQSSKKTNRSVSDSGNKKENLDFIVIPEIKIAGAIFRETGAAVASFNNGNLLSCFQVDGIIGANLMRNCYVQVDYLSQKIRFAKEWTDLKLEDGFEVPFTHHLQATPLVRLKVGELTIDQMTVDTGFNGFINLSKSDYKQAKITQPGYDIVGNTSEGLFGATAPDTTKKIWMGDYTLDTTALALAGSLSFESKNKRLIGNEFLSNFITTYDWKRKKIHFAPVMKAAVMPQGYNAGVQRVGNRAEISYVRLDSEEHRMGLYPGVQVLAVNDIDTRVFDETGMCAIYALFSEKKETIRLQVKINDTEQWITLERKDMY